MRNNKLVPCLISLLLLTSCQNTAYQLIQFPTSEYNFLSDYKVVATSANLSEEIFIRAENSEQEALQIEAPNNKQFLQVTFEFLRFIVLEQSNEHVLDEDDFKIKDHLGYKLEDALTPHISLIDYTWKNASFQPGDQSLPVTVSFEIDDSIDFTNSFIVIEIDFFALDNDGIDIAITESVNG